MRTAACSRSFVSPSETPLASAPRENVSDPERHGNLLDLCRLPCRPRGLPGQIALCRAWGCWFGFVGRDWKQLAAALGSFWWGRERIAGRCLSVHPFNSAQALIVQARKLVENRWLN